MSVSMDEFEAQFNSGVKLDKVVRPAKHPRVKFRGRSLVDVVTPYGNAVAFRFMLNAIPDDVPVMRKTITYFG